MKTTNDKQILEKKIDGETLYGVFFNDDTMYNFYYTPEEASDVVDILNKEDSHNKCRIKTFPKSEIEK